MLASYQYRGHIIRFEVEQNPDTLYWQARGVIELIEGETIRSFMELKKVDDRLRKVGLDV
jgi:hypothetical protein